MAHITQDELKTAFESGDLPTQSDFVDLIDTLEANFEVKTITVAEIAPGNDVWDDVNASTLITQTTKQLYTIIHAGTYYMFNGGVDTYGLGGNTATVEGNYIQISNTLDLTKLSVQIISVTENRLDNTKITLSTLVTELNNVGPAFTHSTNEVTIIYHRTPFAHLKDQYHYLFDGEPDTYGVGNTTVASGNFKKVSQTYATLPTFITRIDVAGTGNVWDDFNATQNLFISPYPGEILIVNHNNYNYLFSPASETDGGIITYGSGATATDTSNFREVSDETWKALIIPLEEQWKQNLTSDYGATAFTTVTSSDGITGPIRKLYDPTYYGKVAVRGYITTTGAVALGDALLSINNSAINCTNPKLVYLSDVTGEVMYLCKWNATSLTAVDPIPISTKLDLDSYYYYNTTYLSGG